MLIKQPIIRQLIVVLIIVLPLNALAQTDMKKFDYPAAWEKVSEHENKGLPASALKAVEEIYEKAKSEKNAEQQVKAIIHRMKFTEYKEENAFVKNLIQIKKETKTAEFPVKPLLHSLLADLYWQYYANNRWKFSQRSEVVNMDQDDIETWSIDKIVQETIHHYELSLKDAELAKKIPVKIYNEVLHSGNEIGKNYRPTLFDFLAHRAVDFYMGQEPEITKPAYAFTINEAAYLSDAETFVKLNITSKDSLSIKLHAMQLLQEITKFHLPDTDPSALVDVELKRIGFVKQHLVLSDKNELYIKCLEALEGKCKKYPISSLVTWYRAAYYKEQSALYNPLQSDDHKWEAKKAWEICADAIQRFPDSYGASLCERMQAEITDKSLSAITERVVVPGLPFSARVTYRNFSKLHWRIIKTNRDEVRAQRKKWERNYEVDREQKFIEFFAGKTSFKAGSVSLPDDSDFQQHSAEIKIDHTPEGEYMILFSHESEFSTEGNGMAYCFITASNLSYIHRNLSDGSTEFYIVNRQTGDPVSGVEIQLYHSVYNDKKGDYEKVKGASFVANQEGYAKVPYQNNNYRYNFSAEFKSGNDRLNTEEIDRDYYYSSSIYQSRYYEQTATVQTFFFLDRAIYRPGQTIYFKGLVTESDGKNPKILAGRSVYVVLYDVNHQEVVNGSFTTNEYGTFQGTFTAPTKGLTGQMRIENTDGSGSVYFSVEEYKRPKFEVKPETVKGSFRLGEVIKAEGQAKAYSGANIDGAKVKYRVVRRARFPYWWWCWYGYYPKSPEMEIANGNTETDATGRYVINFPALPDLSVDKASDPVFIYTVYVDVTDLNGETHSATSSVYIGYKALEVGVDISDIDKSDEQARSAKPAINTKNLAGEFEPASGRITIHKLKNPERTFRTKQWERADRFVMTKEEYYNNFPYDVYADEDNYMKWPKEKEVLNVSFDTNKDKNLSLSDLKSWAAGQYVLEITSRDKFGQDVKEITYFKVYSSKDTRLAIPEINRFDGINVSVEPGSKASFLAGTSAGRIRVLYEIEKDNKIIAREWLVLRNEQRLLEIPVKEEYRGNIGVHYTFVLNNRFYHTSETVVVPYTNKELEISFETFRDKLQPGEAEEWKLKIKGKTSDKIAAEMVATLYDASLDVFRSNSWYAGFYHTMYARLGWSSVNGFEPATFNTYTNSWNVHDYGYGYGPSYDQFNWFGYTYYRYYRNRYYGYEGDEEREYAVDDLNPLRREVSRSMPAPAAKMKKESADLAESNAPENIAFGDFNKVIEEKQEQSKGKEQDMSDVKVRKNFNETAFFYPNLYTNEQGEIVVKFTVPEALTRWKMLGFAHTKDLKSGSTTNQLVTQKELMVVPNQPRFFRENDKMVFAVKITSLSEKELSGQAQLEFFDALTMKPVNDLMKNNSFKKDFTAKAGQSVNLEWSVEIPEGLQALAYRVIAKAGNFSDGEEMTLPVVTNRMLVTESLPLPIRGNQTKEFRFDKLLNNKSTTLKSHRYTLEFTSNPAWYAIQALPYLMEYPYECVEQTFSRFYANSIATHIANSNPKIKQVFDTWKNIQPDALLSNLEKNQELKTAILEETPWVLQAQNESQRKRNVALLFDLNRMANEMDRALDKILKAQLSSGGFTWFPGFPEDRYMTQHIVGGIGHLDVLGVKAVREDDRTWDMAKKAMGYLDRQIRDDYEMLKALAKKGEIKLEDDHLGHIQIHYLYVRSYFKDIEISKTNKESFDYFMGQAKKYWLRNSLYTEGMIALALHRYGDTETPRKIIRSLNERALHSEEMGMYWKSESGYFWYQAPIETQALMIEVYDEVAGDKKSVEDLKVWLLKQKQTQDWKTTRATTEACYALLRRGTDLLASDRQVEIKLGDEVIDPAKREDVKIEAGTGYFKTAWMASDIKPEMGKITVSKKDDGVAWGAVYWQYFEQLDKITPAETPLKLSKQLFLQQNTDRGPVITPVTDKTELKVGDLIKVRVELRVDRNMEYVHLKDMRAAGLEPVNTISTHRYQDGLWYYESTRDLATNFFIGYLPKGTYVFEYSLRVSIKGDFSNGITTIQCMYAPEFSSHSQGIRVKIGQ